MKIEARFTDKLPPAHPSTHNATVRGFLQRLPCFTVLGRSLLLVILEIAANVICWAIAARSRSFLSLAILAWTIGLRHALDADHISAIDNATRNLINHGKLSVTCGLFFSLGHSTIVIVVNAAIIISTGVYEKLNGVGSVGSIIGPAVSSSFLFIVGLANSVILWKILRQRRRARCKGDSEDGDAYLEPPPNQNMLMMRFLGPLVNFVDRPWKMYPVGVLFGFGFDTASSIALLAISALAKDDASGNRIPPSQAIILPLLFTTGMTLVDSLDSILMLYSYSGFADLSWKIIEPRNALPTASAQPMEEAVLSTRSPEARTASVGDGEQVEVIPLDSSPDALETGEDNKVTSTRDDSDRMTRVKRNTMSALSIVLTTMSILLAFSISFIEIMGLIGDNCTKCQAAASAPDGGGLAGQWWRGWARANDNSGYIGAAIVGVFVIIVSGWYVTRWGTKKMKGKATTGWRNEDRVDQVTGDS
ncbi:NicO-domain-containing protein [Paxillus ammoniavirescens]|nr:NicO-domain-containing protein [Paxillus ammoniavirescens]